MANDYHIFIHADGVGNGTSPTKPRKSSKPTQSKQSKEERNFEGKVRQVAGFLENPDSIIGQAKSAAIAKAGVAGAVVMVAYNIGMKVASEAVDLQATLTGDITNQVALNNVRNVIGVLTSPISSTISYLKYNVQRQQQNERARLNQQLLGDSVVNQNYNRKV